MLEEDTQLLVIMYSISYIILTAVSGKPIEAALGLLAVTAITLVFVGVLILHSEITGHTPKL